MTLTATAEPETAAPPPVAERPVFAATTPVRPRALRLAGRLTAGLVALWLVALVLGTFGFGPVAGIGLPRLGGGGNGVAKPQREAAHKARAQQQSQRVTQSGVTLTGRRSGHTATRANGRGGKATGSNRPAATPHSPASQTGGSRGSQPSHPAGGSGGGSGTTAQTPSASSTPASAVTPTSSTTTTTNPHANTTHSHATPPGSSSAAPGSRSNASNAPGRDNSASSPSPGSGRSGHTPPHG